MLKTPVNHLKGHQSPPLLSHVKKAFIGGDGALDASGLPTSFLSVNTLAFPVKRHSRSFRSRRHAGKSAGEIKAVAGQSSAASTAAKTTSVKATITVQMTVGGVLSNLNITRAFDDIGDLLGKSLLLELVAAEADSGKCTYKLALFPFLFEKTYIYTILINLNKDHLPRVWMGLLIFFQITG